MRKSSLLILFFFIFLAGRQVLAGEFADLKANPAAFPTMTWFMLQHIDEYSPSDYSQLEITDDLILLSSNFSKTQAKDIKVFLISQIYKTLFDFTHSKLVDAKNLNISKSHILSAQKKLKDNKAALSKSVIHLISEMIGDYEPFLEDNSITNYQNTSQKSLVSAETIKKIHRLNKHVGPWIALFLRFNSKKFNHYYSSKVKHYLKSAVQLSYYFKFHQNSPSKIKLFEYKDGGLQSLKSALLVKAKAKETKSENSPAEDVKNLEIDPGSAASEKIDSIIKNLDEKTE